MNNTYKRSDYALKAEMAEHYKALCLKAEMAYYITAVCPLPYTRAMWEAVEAVDLDGLNRAIHSEWLASLEEGVPAMVGTPKFVPGEHPVQEDGLGWRRRKRIN